MADPASYRSTAERAWQWTLDQVHWDDGPWIPETVPEGQDVVLPDLRDGMHSGIGGLAHVLAEVRLTRAWTNRETQLADAVAERLRNKISTSTDATFFDGLVSTLGAMTALGAPGADEVVVRLSELATDDGWPQTALTKVGPQSRINDLTLGTAGVVLAGLWADQMKIDDAAALAARAADVLLAEGEPTDTGTFWRFVPARFRDGTAGEMPNLSHGLAGIAAALALAGARLDRPDLVDAARSGAEHLVSLGEVRDGGFAVPRYLPRDLNDEDVVTYTWCHGAAGTSLLFRALDHVGVDEVAGQPPSVWHRRCLHSVRTSGLPARGHPGFWDNDGRCCGTAGVGDVFLDAWQRGGDPDDLAFARACADALVDRAVVDDEGHTYWRFVEHRAEDPLLPPGVGWMQGAAGIAAYLFRTARLVEQGADAETLPRMENWWAGCTGTDTGEGGTS